ncbi:dsDNA nuclease domain-containing protein [Tistlia consotensis]|nr:dsDNA nuclease domain-containing protein [Tistlia consotensis]
MSDNTHIHPVEWPSVDESLPVEEGGPVARTGFNYQDEIAVGFLLDMLERSDIEKIHCETHDDILVVRTHESAAERIAEFVQVKAGEPKHLWSVAGLCQRKKSKPGTSIFEISLARDKYKETALFRIVTLRDVDNDLKLLTYGADAPARQPECDDCKALLAAIEKRCPGSKSEKGNCTDYWITNCHWDVRHSEAAIKRENLLRLIKISNSEGRTLLFDQAELLLIELRRRAKAAGDAKPKSKWHEKIITQSTLRSWWEQRMEELVTGVSAPSGGKLKRKMEDAELPQDLVALALDLRRRYAKSSRTSRYMEAELGETLRDRVEAEVLSLRSKLIAGELDLDGPSFHALCVARLDKINAAREPGADDRSAFLKGCMYDIADRCMMRFVRPQ